MEKKNEKSNLLIKLWKNRKKKSTWIMLSMIILFVLITFSVIKREIKEFTNRPKEDFSSTIKKMVDISELSTYEMIYSGVVEIKNEKKKKIDYYVKYDAIVKIGLDTSDIEVTMDKKTEKVIVNLPDIEINNVVLNNKKLEYMFHNEKANDIEQLENLYDKCKKDARKEVEKNEAPFKLSKENAKNQIKAVVNQFIEQYNKKYDKNYELVIR